MSGFCVIGDPIAHSLSPLLQNALLRALDIPQVYVAQRVPAGETADFLRRAKAGAFAGFNATMPHKTALLPLLEERTQAAQLCGAVNAVRIENGRAIGHNTDGAGFLLALGNFSPQGKTVAILGAGGAARALAFALSSAGAARIQLLGRTKKSAELLAGVCPRTVAQEDFTCLAEADLLVNATPLGMAGNAFETLDFLELLPPEARVCDLIYQPMQTEFLRRARALHHRAQNGLPLLMAQAVLSLAFLTDRELTFADMRPILLRALRENGILTEEGEAE